MRPRKDDNSTIIGGKQLLVLQAIFRLRDDAYGASIYRLLSDDNNATALPQIYSVLGKLDGKGLVTSFMGEATPERGGRCKRLYEITGKGQRVLNASLQRSPQEIKKPWAVPDGVVST